MADSVIGVQMYTVRDFMQTPEDTAEAYHKVADIGYRIVEPAGYGGMEVADMAELLSSLGLQACSSHVGCAALRDTPEGVAEELGVLGCEWAVSGPLGELTTQEDWVAFAQEASEVAGRLSELGLNYAYHNHSFELEKFGDRTALEILYEGSDPDLVNAQIDTYWIQHGGGSSVAWIDRLAERVPMLHMKDMTMHGHEQFMAEVGEGNLDWEGILAAARDAGVQWYIVEQDTCERDPFESLAISFNNLKKMGLD